MALTKIDIVENLMQKQGLSKKVALEIVEMFFEEIRATLAAGEEVKLSGFGNFMLRDKKARPGRNPHPASQESVEIPARRVVLFKSSPKWRELTQARISQQESA